MELAQILKILWAHKVWLAVVFVVACVAALSTGYQIGPGTFKARSHSYGAAEAQFLVDSPRSSLADLTQDTESLASRAQLYTQYMRSNDVKLEIAKEAGVDPDQIVTEGPYMTAGGTQNIPRPPVVRSNEVLGEPQIYRLVFDAQLGLPIVSIYAQAPTAAEAITLADASVDGDPTGSQQARGRGVHPVVRQDGDPGARPSCRWHGEPGRRPDHRRARLHRDVHPGLRSHHRGRHAQARLSQPPSGSRRRDVCLPCQVSASRQARASREEPPAEVPKAFHSCVGLERSRERHSERRARDGRAAAA